jgi:prevent-host-death family protein
MRRWPVQDAKARFSALLDATIRKGPQIVTKRGVEAAVLVSAAEWRRLASKRGERSLKELLLAPTPRADIPLPKRGKTRRRKPILFD